MALLFAAGCSSGGEGGVGSEALAERLLSDTSEFQREFIEDGVVTEAEYDSASVALVACIQEKLPLATVNRPWDPTQGAQVSQATTDDEADQWFERASEVQSECGHEFYEDVQAMYIESIIPMGAARQKQQEEVLQCLESVGVEDVPSVESSDGVVMDAAVLHDNEFGGTEAELCVAKHQFAFVEQFQN